jgi:plasmid stability protein
MAQMVVRNIDDEVARRFKAKAKAGGKSAEQVVRDLMAEHVKPTTEDLISELDAIRETTKGKRAIDPVEIIRRDRENDHGRL